MDYNFHWRPVLRKLPELLEAALATLQVASLSIIIGIVIGLLLAIARMNAKGKLRPLAWLATCWVELARNTPALFQLFFFGFGLGAFGIHLSPFTIVLCGLSFNNAGYLAENREHTCLVQQARYRIAVALGYGQVGNGGKIFPL